MNTKCFNTHLCTTNNGQVSLSNCGRCYRINFNNIMIFQGYEEYLGFFKKVEDCHYAVKDDTDISTRDIVFGTCSTFMILCFSVQEIAELYYLLQSALIEANIYV